MSKQTLDPLEAWLTDLGKDLVAFVRTVFSPEIFRRDEPAGSQTDWESTFPELLDEITEQAAGGKPKPGSAQKLAALQQRLGSEAFRRRKDFDTFLQVFQRVFAARNQLMRQRLAQLPIYAASRNAWNPGDVTANNNIVHALVRKVNPLLEEAYRCYAAQITVTDRMRGDLDGLFNPKRRLVFINKNLYRHDFDRFFITYIHEQMHCLQFDMMQRFADPRERQHMDADEAYLVQYWQAERLDYIKCFFLLNRDKKMPDLYFRLGQEVHAETIGQVVAGDG